jgi:hypothetical protein
MLEMLKRHEVEILLKAGHPKAEVARLAGVSLRSVNRIAEEANRAHFSGHELQTLALVSMTHSITTGLLRGNGSRSPVRFD